MPEFTFPLSIIVLAYIATAILLVIMILLFRMAPPSSSTRRPRAKT